MNNKHTFTLSTQSPVSIGNGETLSPLSDYIWHNSKIYFIDEKKFENYLLTNNLIDFYTKEVFKFSGKSKNNFLDKDILKGNFKEYCKQETIDAYIKGNAIEIQQITHNVGKPYIPGSSIKGAIKTALLYNWLVFDKEGKKQCKELINRSNQKFKQNKNIIEEYCELKQEKRKNWDRINKLKGKLKKESNGVIRNAEMIINNFLDLIGNNELAKEFSFLRISDSSEVNFNNKAVYETSRLNIRNKKQNEKLIILKEALKPNTSMEVNMSFIPKFRTKYLKAFNSEPIKFLKENLYYFAYNAACFEFDKLEQYSFSPKHENPLKFYDNLIENYSSESDFSYLILGSGKTYLENSLGLAIYDFNEKNGFSDYNNFVRIAGISDYCQKEYPTTRTLTTVDNLPLGWVKIQLKK